VQFDISMNLTATVNIMLLYSESKELGDPCEWNGNTEGYTRYQSICNEPMSPGVTVDITADGMDGSGTFFILVERVSGAGETVTVTPTLLGNCPAPSNDRCSSPIALSVGNGIDPGVLLPVPPIPEWSNALKGSIACATKQRLTDGCGTFNNGTPTEDHYKSNILGNCVFKGNLGDNTLVSQCDEYLENTVYYTFQVPVSGNDYYIHFGSSGPCAQEPNNLVYMIFSSIDCSDAQSSTRIACNKTSINGTVPTADWSYDGFGSGITLNAGTTYWIVVDGTRQSQCDFCILIARGPDNPVLPAEFLSFSGDTEPFGNVLEWSTRIEDGISSFEVERSADGESFEVLGDVLSEGNVVEGARYSFLDRTPPAGKSFYRVKTVDVNGIESTSRVIQLTRELAQASLIDVYPQPAQDELKVLLSLPEAGAATFHLFDLAGRKVASFSHHLSSGNQEISLPLGQLSRGLYLLKAQVGTQSYQRKILLN
jgi:hypothetical protein